MVSKESNAGDGEDLVNIFSSPSYLDALPDDIVIFIHQDEAVAHAYII